MNRLEGKVAIVTGAARGMAVAHVRMLVFHGAKVVFTAYSSIDAGEALAREIGPSVRFVAQDVRREEDWANVVRVAEENFGHVTTLVNNAALLVTSPVEQMSAEDFRDVCDVNVTGAFLGIKTVAPSMRKAGGGSIINISSTVGIIGALTSVAYGASKFAIRGLTKSAALELAPANIRVNSVHPGAIESNMSPENEAIKQRILPRIPLARIAKADEVSHLIVYLASDESLYCTGAEFIIDGGFTAQ